MVTSNITIIICQIYDGWAIQNKDMWEMFLYVPQTLEITHKSFAIGRYYTKKDAQKAMKKMIQMFKNTYIETVVVGE